MTLAATVAQPPVALRNAKFGLEAPALPTASVHCWEMRPRSSGWMASIHPSPSVSSGR